MSIGYETDAASWREEFEKAYVEWVDLELIKTLLDSMNCSIRFLCEAINDTTRWPSRINKTLKTISYPRLREAADFLGIPPWLLFYHEEKNNRIRELFERINSVHKPIHLPYYSEHESLYLDFFYELSKRVRSQTDYEILSNKLNELIGHLHYHQVLFGNWKAVVSFFNEIHRDFSGGARFYYRDTDTFIEGDVRLHFATNPRNKRILIKSGWLAFQTDHDVSSSSDLLHKFIASIRTDMEWVFDQQPWIFSLESRGKHTHLLTWNNLRTSNEHYEQVAKLINKKLLKSKLTMNIDEQHQNSVPGLLVGNPFEEFIKIIKMDVSTSQEPKYLRRKNTLQLLFEGGEIRDGDRISLLHSKITEHLLQQPNMCHASIVFRGGKPLVKWDYDANLYSISKLTRILLVDICGQSKLKNHNLNGNRYWKLQHQDKSLFDLVRSNPR